MSDSSGNYVEDTWSVSESQYREGMSDSSSDDSSDGSEGYEDSGNYDDSGEYDGSEEYY